MKNKDPISHKILTGGPGPPGTLSLYYYLSFFFNIYIYMVIFEGPDPPTPKLADVLRHVGGK